MKNHLQNDVSLYCRALSGPSISDVIVALGSAASIGFVGLLPPLNR